MEYAPTLLSVIIIICVTILSWTVGEDGMDREPYFVGLVFGALTALAVMTLLGGVA